VRDKPQRLLSSLIRLHTMSAELPTDGSISDPDWSVEPIVSRLRSLREQAQLSRQRRGSPLKLPTRQALDRIVDQISMALFPIRLSQRELRQGNVDYFVGSVLDQALTALAEQVMLELRFFSGNDSESGDLRPRARQLVRDFADRLPQIRLLLDTDIQAAFEGDPAARSIDEVLVCYPGISAILHHRVAHELYRLDSKLIARLISEIAHSRTGIDIHPGAQISGHFFIDHGTGVVIGETAIIGERVRIYQAVTLGAKSFPSDEHGVLVKGNARHPIVEDGVVIYSGATVLGRITIGRNSVIGGNVWLTSSVPPGSMISQAKLRHEQFAEGSGI